MRRLNPALVYWLQTWGTEENKRTGLEYPGTTPIGQLLSSPGRGTKANPGPRYEPDVISAQVSRSIQVIGLQDSSLLTAKYVEGMSDRVIGLICRISEGKARWALEVAHRNIARELNMPVYR